MSHSATWGVCATIKAPACDIVRFAAYHLDAGAGRIWVFLDAENPEAYEALDAHPKCTVITCNDDYWRRIFGRRPAKHQARQARNATRTLARAGEVDWLLHIDVDEFLVTSRPVSEILANVPDAAEAARVRPMEVLAQDNRDNGKMAFKTFVPEGDARLKEVRAMYPTYGDYVIGGFVSHLAGKLFVRTSATDVIFRVHTALREEERLTAEVELDAASLAHLHAPNWRTWLQHFDYRFAHGAYRPGAAPARAPDGKRISLHDFFDALIEQQGTDGLRQFFEEVCADTPLLRERLAEHGRLRFHDLELDAKVHQHFPEFRPFAATV